jgi:hypothetical protein
MRHMISTTNEDIINNNADVFTEEFTRFGRYIDTRPGWHDLIANMVTEVKEALAKEPILDFSFLQVKQKFGQLRVYCHPHRDDISKIITKYEDLSLEVCELCGNESTENTESMRVRCVDCLGK